MVKVWVEYSSPSGSKDWDFTDKMEEINKPTVFNLLKTAAPVFGLPLDDAGVQMLFNKETVTNRKLLSSFKPDEDDCILFTIAYHPINELTPTKFLSPLDFREQQLANTNDEATMVFILKKTLK